MNLGKYSPFIFILAFSSKLDLVTISVICLLAFNSSSAFAAASASSANAVLRCCESVLSCCLLTNLPEIL